MHPLIENNREAIARLCRLHGVRSLEAFGSILRDDFATAGCAITSSRVNHRYMPQRDPGVYLEDIEHYAAAAARFTSGFSLEQYLADEKTRAAVDRVLEVCGEAMSNLYRVAPTVAETIPHARDIIGFRNILALCGTRP
jgi:uncharacterized protein with HEPN domain